MRWRKVLLVFGVVLTTATGMNLLFPLPDPAGAFSVVVTDRHGTPLRGFADNQGVWRYPLQLDQVSPRYLEALLRFEDRWFYQHPGINPFALLRAAWQSLKSGRIVAGGSTLTMQTARLLDPHSRTVWGKLKQLGRALQLEWHYSKQEILTLYLNHAPFGGPLAGVQAASLAYLGKGAGSLSHAEAALLAVLPQAPSRLRPDRFPAQARKARDKVLERLVTTWGSETVAAAKLERISSRLHTIPIHAPLLAERVLRQQEHHGLIRTTLEAEWQRRLEQKASVFAATLPDKSSLAILLVENDSLAVRGYVGSAEYTNARCFGALDMVRAWRSPGSTLKPFLYGLALDDGLIHSESLLLDTPQEFSGWNPSNFDSGYSGPVSVQEALQRSLNLPAVQLLAQLGPERLAGRLSAAGLRLRFPKHGPPTLAMILGGVAVRLDELTAAYAALARGGKSAPLRYTVAQEQRPLEEHALLSSGAAWIVLEMLRRSPPDLSDGPLRLTPNRQVAWKTGTSYGFRDAWALGVTRRFTVGIWVGRPDGTPLPGHYGAVTALPLLFDITDSLPDDIPTPIAKPMEVNQQEICWPSGLAPSGADDPLCPLRRTAWVLNGVIPPTLPEREERLWTAGVWDYWINSDTGLRLDSSCTAPQREPRRLARWPLAAMPWLAPRLRQLAEPPQLDPSCPPTPPPPANALRIVGLSDGAYLRPAGSAGGVPVAELSAVGGGEQRYWLVNGQLTGRTKKNETFQLPFTHPGTWEITVLDDTGQFQRISVRSSE